MAEAERPIPARKRGLFFIFSEFFQRISGCEEGVSYRANIRLNQPTEERQPGIEPV